MLVSDTQYLTARVRELEAENTELKAQIASNGKADKVFVNSHTRRFPKAKVGAIDRAVLDTILPVLPEEAEVKLFEFDPYRYGW